MLLHDAGYLYSLSCSVSTGSRPQGFWMGVMRFCLAWCGIMGVGWAGCPGDCVWGGKTGEAAGGKGGGAGEGRPVGCGGRSFWGMLEGAAAFTMGPGRDMRTRVRLGWLGLPS